MILKLFDFSKIVNHKKKKGLFPNMTAITKKGKLVEDQAGTVLLVNEKEQAFRADESVIAIWQMCDGTRTKEDICTVVKEQTDMTTDDAERVVSDIIGKLREVELVT